MALILSSIPVINSLQKNDEPLTQNFTGEKSSFEGVITIWNVDTFESGSVNKIDILENASVKFSAQNKGVYFIVKNVTVNELMSNLSGGIFPDIISFGFGIGNLLKPFLMPLDNEFGGVRDEILNSSVFDGSRLCVGYLMGGYILASSKEKLEKTSYAEETNLKNIINSAGYTYGSGKKQTEVKSVIVGDNPYVNYCTAMNNFENLALTNYHLSASGYDAYVDFINYNKGTILVGTHRDLYKLSGRVKVGKISDVVINYLEGYTNLVQYAGVINSVIEEKKDTCKKFLDFLLSEEMQKYSTKIGMVNVCGNSYYEDGEFKLLETALNRGLKIPNIFDK